MNSHKGRGEECERLTTERLHRRKEKYEGLGDSAVREVCQDNTMTDREKLRVHALSADHEVVCTSWYNCMIRKGVH